MSRNEGIFKFLVTWGAAAGLYSAYKMYLQERVVRFLKRNDDKNKQLPHEQQNGELDPQQQQQQVEDGVQVFTDDVSSNDSNDNSSEQNRDDYDRSNNDVYSDKYDKKRKNVW